MEGREVGIHLHGRYGGISSSSFDETQVDVLDFFEMACLGFGEVCTPEFRTKFEEGADEGGVEGFEMMSAKAPRVASKTTENLGAEASLVNKEIQVGFPRQLWVQEEAQVLGRVEERDVLTLNGEGDGVGGKSLGTLE